MISERRERSKPAIKQLEQQYGDLNQIIPKLVNQGGQKFAAFQLGTTQINISRWLKDNGYKQEIKWVKQTDLEHA